MGHITITLASGKATWGELGQRPEYRPIGRGTLVELGFIGVVGVLPDYAIDDVRVRPTRMRSRSAPNTIQDDLRGLGPRWRWRSTSEYLDGSQPIDESRARICAMASRRIGCRGI